MSKFSGSKFTYYIFYIRQKKWFLTMFKVFDSTFLFLYFILYIDSIFFDSSIPLVQFDILRMQLNKQKCLCHPRVVFITFLTFFEIILLLECSFQLCVPVCVQSCLSEWECEWTGMQMIGWHKFWIIAEDYWHQSSSLKAESTAMKKVTLTIWKQNLSNLTLVGWCNDS